MATLLAEADRVRGADCRVVIQGETGTGKEVLARRIHGNRGPFLIIDCTHLSSQLAESELFGTTKGAYTGAYSDRSGLIEAADGGTAFFDEIGELPLDVQAKLLRLLQEGTYRRVGSTVERRSKFRVIAATNRDLKRESQLGRFREDLYYRLNIVKLKVPPLRERKEDIPPLVNHFLRGTGLEMPPHVLAVLLQYNWPGNVRELEACIRRMVAQSDGTQLRSEQLPPTLCAEVGKPPIALMRRSDAASQNERPLGSDVAGLPTIVPLMPLQRLERIAILQALRETRDRTAAAAKLGIGRTTLYRKLNEMRKDRQFSQALDDIVGVADIP